jgi:heme-degrading monooxygenase HmoA
MYAALVNYSVKSGHLDEAIRLWRAEVEPAAEGQPGYEGSVLLVDPASNRLVVVAYWDTKAHDDAFATTGPWRAGSELRNKIDVLLSEEPSRVEMEVAYLNAPHSL